MFRGIRWYDTVFIKILGDPYNILRYDQVLHLFIFMVFTLFAYSVIIHIVGKKTSKIAIGVLAVLAGIGIGALNEIIEFFTVVFFNAGATVGGYYNTALDLVFNFIGALTAVFLAFKFPNNFKEN